MASPTPLSYQSSTRGGLHSQRHFATQVSENFVSESMTKSPEFRQEWVKRTILSLRDQHNAQIKSLWNSLLASHPPIKFKRIATTPEGREFEKEYHYTNKEDLPKFIRNISAVCSTERLVFDPVLSPIIKLIDSSIDVTIATMKKTAACATFSVSNIGRNLAFALAYTRSSFRIVLLNPSDHNTIECQSTPRPTIKETQLRLEPGENIIFFVASYGIRKLATTLAKEQSRLSFKIDDALLEYIGRIQRQHRGFNVRNICSSLIDLCRRSPNVGNTTIISSSESTMLAVFAEKTTLDFRDVAMEQNPWDNILEAFTPTLNFHYEQRLKAEHDAELEAEKIEAQRKDFEKFQPVINNLLQISANINAILEDISLRNTIPSTSQPRTSNSFGASHILTTWIEFLASKLEQCSIDNPEDLSDIARRCFGITLIISNNILNLSNIQSGQKTLLLTLIERAKKIFAEHYPRVEIPDTIYSSGEQEINWNYLLADRKLTKTIQAMDPQQDLVDDMYMFCSPTY